MFYVYVLYDKQKFYIGFTADLEQRLKDHKRGKVHTTKRYNLEKLKLIYAEMFVSEKDARRREQYLKTTKGRKGLRLILRETLKS
ncbi:MAG: GIY-YIG nuclease family protein [Patescibacteria group bacterium]|nr:GIY-YIG nuclease family protein [Patescibacteria group bacterium]